MAHFEEAGGIFGKVTLKHVGIAFGVAVIAGVMVSLLDSYVVQRAEAAVGLVPSQA